MSAGPGQHRNRPWAGPALTATGIGLMGALPAFMLGGLAVQVRADLVFTEARLGLAVSAFFLIAAVGSTPAGRLADRWGWRRVSSLVALGSSVSLLGIALVARSWGVLVALLVVGGLANAASQPSANLLLVRTVPHTRQGIAFGVKQSAVPLATMLGGAMVPLVALTLGWRWAFGFVALLPVLVVASRRFLHGAPSPPTVGRAQRSPRGRRAVPGSLLLLAFATALAGGAAGVLGVFLVAAGVDRGLPEGVAGTVLAVGGFAGAAARVVAGVLADRIARLGLHVVAALLLVGAAGFVLLGAGGGLALFSGGVLLCFTAGWGWNGLLHLGVVRGYAYAPAAATGVIQTGMYVGGTFAPALFGYVVLRAGYGAAWMGAAGAMALAAALVAASGRRRSVEARAAGQAPVL